MVVKNGAVQMEVGAELLCTELWKSCHEPRVGLIHVYHHTRAQNFTIMPTACRRVSLVISMCRTGLMLAEHQCTRLRSREMTCSPSITRANSRTCLAFIFS